MKVLKQEPQTATLVTQQAWKTNRDTRLGEASSIDIWYLVRQIRLHRLVASVLLWPVIGYIRTAISKCPACQGKRSANARTDADARLHHRCQAEKCEGKIPCEEAIKSVDKNEDIHAASHPGEIVFDSGRC